MYLDVGRYMFNAKEENVWGPDFVRMMSFDSEEKVAFHRMVLFQAKLIKKGRVRIDLGQLQNLLRSSGHSSFYILWEPRMKPHGVSAALLDEFLRSR